MILKLLRLFFFASGIIFLAYLTIPSPGFPEPPPDSQVSTEPGDVRDPFIRGYYTDLNREKIISFYMNQFGKSQFMGLPLINIRLGDYPPEEASLRIVDELKSSYLEEIVHPLRESIFISVWEPTDPRFALIVDGRRFQNKVTFRYYPSHPISRFFIGAATLVVVWLIVKISISILKSKSK